MILIDQPIHNNYSHLVSDDLKELHDFASKLGIKPHWFENKKGKFKPHYDVYETKFDSCIKNGAILTSTKDITKFLDKHHGRILRKN